MERWGGILIAPQPTLVQIAQGSRGGFNDLILLLLLQTIALRLPDIARLGWHAIDVSPTRAALFLLNLLARAMMIPFIAALGGGVVLRWLGGTSQSDRTMDIAALCVVPSVGLQLAASALALLFPTILYRPAIRRVVQLAGGAWFAALLGIALRMLRRGLPSEPPVANE